MALWLVQSDSFDGNGNSVQSSQSDDSGMVVPSYEHIRPQAITECSKAEKVRALAYHSKQQVSAAVLCVCVLLPEFSSPVP